MQITVTRQGVPITFDSSHTNDSALAILRTLTTPMARDLAAKAPRLSAAQWAWVHKLAVDGQRVAPNVAGLAPLTKLVNLFAEATAVGNLKRPAITFRVADAVIRIKRAGLGSRYVGQLMIVDDQPFGTNKFFGRIDTDGTFTTGRDCTDAIVCQLVAVNDDPAKAARDYGKLTGRCCFCDSGLKDERSTVEGYGPICARKWGLPWGNTAGRTLADTAPTFN